MNQEEEIIEFALRAGRLLLSNGAEIFRVEETIRRICNHYAIDTMDAFVLSNGIFITANHQKQIYARVKHIPVSATHLDIVTSINQLSRNLEVYNLTIEEANQALDRIEQMSHYSSTIYILASGIGSGAFCYLFGGSFYDALIAFIAGFILYIYVLTIGKHLSKIPMNIIGGIIVSMICGIVFHHFPDFHLAYMIIGSIMPLIPGVAFINSIREIANGDYLSGTVRMLDAMVVFISIAIGVGFAMNILTFLFGGFKL